MPFFFAKRTRCLNAGNNLVGESSRRRYEKGHGAGSAFKFGTWLRLHGVDLITMAVMGAIGWGVYFAGMMNAP